MTGLFDRELKPGDLDGDMVFTGTQWVRAEVRADHAVDSNHPAFRLPAERAVDFVARLAEAWDYDGRHAFAASGREHRALLAMAGLEFRLADVRWNRLEGYQRQALVRAARHAVTLGRACAWVFGEGQGA